MKLNTSSFCSETEACSTAASTRTIRSERRFSRFRASGPSSSTTRLLNVSISESMFFLFPSFRDEAGHFYACLPLCTHRKLVDTTLNETCRLITGCIRPTATPDLCVLSGIAPPEIRRSIHCQNERTKQLTDQRHSPPPAREKPPTLTQ